MDFKEAVKGVNFYRGGGHQLVYLGKMGWFHAYTQVMAPYMDDQWEKVYTLDDISKHPGKVYDSMLVPRNLQRAEYLLKSVSDRLSDLGFRKMEATVLFTDSGMIGGANTMAEHIPSYHIIRLGKARVVTGDQTSLKTSMHIVAHEFAHHYFKQLPKEDKANLTKFSLNQAMRGFVGAPTAYSTYDPKEMFSEIVAIAVAEPEKLNKQYKQLLVQVLSGTLPKQELKPPDEDLQRS